MRIDHVALYCIDLEAVKHFFIRCVLLIHKDEWKPFRYNHNFGIKPLFRE